MYKLTDRFGLGVVQLNLVVYDKWALIQAPLADFKGMFKVMGRVLEGKWDDFPYEIYNKELMLMK